MAKKNFIQRAASRIGNIFAPEQKKHIGNWGRSSYTTSVNEHAIINLINECNSNKRAGKKIAGDPRAKLEIYRALDWAFPFISRAINIHADFMGRPIVETENEALKAQIESFWNSFYVCGELKSDFDLDKGMELFARDLLKQTLRDGLQPYKIEVADDGKTINGARLHDSAKFDFEWNESSNMYQLRYTNAKLPIKPNDFFQICKVSRSSQFLWGIPLTYNTEFYAETLLRVMIARRDSHIRVGNPPSFTTLSYDLPDNIHDKDLQSSLMDLASDKADQVMDGYKSALSRMYETGRPEDMVMMLPGKMKLDTKMFGQGAQGINNYSQEYELYALQIAMSTDVPVEFLGMRGASAGLGTDFFRVMKEMLTQRKRTNQHIIGTHVKHITDLYLISINANSNAMNQYTIGWDEPDISDEKMAAETDKFEAEAFAAQMLNYMDLRLNLGQDNANQYAEEIGRENLKL